MDRQLKRHDWERTENELELVYLPGFPQVVEAAVVVNSPANRYGWFTLGITGACVVPALLVGGVLTLLQGYNCSGRPACCDLPLDPLVNSSLPCDGLAGYSHAHHCFAACDSNYLSWMMMASLFGIMLSFMVVMIRNNSSTSTLDEDDEDACDFCFGKGDFCSEENLQLQTLEVIQSDAQVCHLLRIGIPRAWSLQLRLPVLLLLLLLLLLRVCVDI